jgi:hypothetical protein
VISPAQNRRRVAALRGVLLHSRCHRRLGRLGRERRLELLDVGVCEGGLARLRQLSNLDTYFKFVSTGRKLDAQLLPLPGSRRPATLPAAFALRAQICRFG